jgi:hypothetical protein
LALVLLVLPVALQEIDYAPDCQARAKRDYQGLQYIYCRIEKCHFFLPPKFLFFVVVSGLPPDRGYSRLKMGIKKPPLM